MQTNTQTEQQLNDNAHFEVQTRLETLTPLELTVFLRRAQPGAPMWVGMEKELGQSRERLRNLWFSACRKMADPIVVPQG
jgi:hypothetical protein